MSQKALQEILDKMKNGIGIEQFKNYSFQFGNNKGTAKFMEQAEDFQEEGDGDNDDDEEYEDEEDYYENED